MNRAVRWGTLLMLVLVGSWLAALIPPRQDMMTQPFYRPGQMGEWVALRTGEVRVTSVNASPVIHTADDEGISVGTWLVVGVDFAPSREPAHLPAPFARDRQGREFTGDLVAPLGCAEGQPGLILGCTFAIEMPLDALEGATLYLPAEEIGDDIPDDVAVVDLEIDRTTAASLAAQTAPITIEPAIVKGKR